MVAANILDLLPWRWPFLMIDRLVDYGAHQRIVTAKNVSAGDSVVNDGGVFPTVMVVEGLSQSAALLYRLSYGDEAASRLPVLGFLKASFSGPAMPGRTILFEVRSVKMTRSGGVFTGSATVEDEVIAEVEMAFAAAESVGRDDEDREPSGRTPR